MIGGEEGERLASADRVGRIAGVDALNHLFGLAIPQHRQKAIGTDGLVHKARDRIEHGRRACRLGLQAEHAGDIGCGQIAGRRHGAAPNGGEVYFASAVTKETYFSTGSRSVRNVFTFAVVSG